MKTAPVHGGARRKAAFELPALLSFSIPCFFGYCPVFMGVLQLAVMEPSATLKVGDLAPDFSLAAANSADVVSLNDTLRKGPAIVEFLRGTW